MADKPNHDFEPIEPESDGVEILPPLPVAAERIPAGSMVYIGKDGKVHPIKPPAPDFVIEMTDADRAHLAQRINEALGRDVL
jgi:hypothetical protein